MTKTRQARAIVDSILEAVVVKYDTKQHAYYDAKARGKMLYTVYAQFDPNDLGAIEELDVFANDLNHARLVGLAALEKDYVPGSTIRDIRNVSRVDHVQFR